MSKLKELINELCPNGIEYKRLEDITKSVNIGINPRKFFKLNPDDATGFYVTVRELNGLNGVNQTEKTDLINDEAINIIQNRANIENGDILFSNTGTVGKMALVNYEVLNWGVNEGIFVIKPNKEIIDSKFLYYYLDSNLAYTDYSKMFTGSTMKHITQKALLSISIPVPPLNVQAEVVRILDAFTSLSAELSSELKARKKQYDYYKDELYGFKDKNVQYVKLKDIAEIIRGGNFQKKDFVENGKPCIHYGQIYTRYGSSANSTFTYVNDEVFNKSKKAQPNDIVMAVTSENVEDVCKCVVWCGNENIAVSGHTAIIHHNINGKYLGYYFSTSHFYKDKTKLVHGTKVMEVTPSSLNDVLIPVPDIKEQERIANLIENFDKLCNDVVSGIPAEIEKRQQQYEHYRDSLLSFKEVKTNE